MKISKKRSPIFQKCVMGQFYEKEEPKNVLGQINEEGEPKM